MTSLEPLRDCACGTVMTPINGYQMCENCDTCQPQERELDAAGRAKPRRITQADRRYHLAWEVKKRQAYGNS